MWQVAVAAAVAGSGLIAKHLFSPNPNAHSSLHSLQTQTQTQTQEEEHEQTQSQQHFTISHLSSPPHSPKTPSLAAGKISQFSADHSDLHTHKASCSSPICEEEGEDGIFRFSSSGSSRNRSGPCSNSKKSRVLGRNKKNVGSFDDDGSVDQRKSGGGKRVLVCLKKRKTNRSSSSSSGKRGDSSCYKDCSSFGWGLGLGIMYMMSAGKAEVSKLSNTIDETAKVVHELKSELDKRKSSHCQQFENSDDATNTSVNKEKLSTEGANSEACTLIKHPIDTKVISHLADSECASSVLTEEQQPEGAEMDQLEAELESELQKLPWCAAETLEHEGNVATLAQIERHEAMNQSSNGYQTDGGVPPAELKNKLSHLLIKQQESHILGLESELNLAYSKLQEKEAELRALKDCVKRLTEFSLSTTISDETEACEEQERSVEVDRETKIGHDNAITGKKRAMEFATHIY